MLLGSSVVEPEPVSPPRLVKREVSAELLDVVSVPLRRPSRLSWRFLVVVLLPSTLRIPLTSLEGPGSVDEPVPVKPLSRPLRMKFEESDPLRPGSRPVGRAVVLEPVAVATPPRRLPSSEEESDPLSPVSRPVGRAAVPELVVVATASGRSVSSEEDPAPVSWRAWELRGAAAAVVARRAARRAWENMVG